MWESIQEPCFLLVIDAGSEACAAAPDVRGEGGASQLHLGDRDAGVQGLADQEAARNGISLHSLLMEP